MFNIIGWVQVLRFNNSAKSSSNSTFWGCFGILKTSRIQNCHWNSILSKISMRKTGKRPRQVKLRGLYVNRYPDQPKEALQLSVYLNFADFRPVLELIWTSRGFIKVFQQYIWTIKPKAHNYYWQCRLIHPKKHPCRCQSPFRLIFSLFWALSRPPEVVKRCFRGTSGLKTQVP